MKNSITGPATAHANDQPLGDHPAPAPTGGMYECPTFAPTDMTKGLALQGLPSTSAIAVARAIVRAVDRRRGPVVVPRWLGALPVAASVTPRWLRDRITALAAGSEQRWRASLGDRSEYEARVADQARDPGARS